MPRLAGLRDFEEAYLVEKCQDGLLFSLAKTVVTGDLKGCVGYTTEALESREMDPLVVLNQGLIAGMDITGERFRKNEVFVPEVLISARAMKGGLAVLRPLLTDTGVKPIGTVLLGTVRGDLHDIGKNIVGMMLEGAGFQVVDIGVDQKPEAFVEAIREHRPVIVGMSAMLTTTMMNMRVTIEAIAQAGLRDAVKIMVGGAPVSQEFADRIGADAYGDNSADGVAKAKELVAAVTCA
jgi:5-methyltetrahydrofolate--homocysteine methyltransferase